MNTTSATATCAFGACTNPPVDNTDPGRPSAFCDLPEHNAATAWLAKYAAQAGGVAEITQLPAAAGFVWEATGANGTTGSGDEPSGSWADAAHDAGAFLDLNGEDPHAGCYQPHRNGEGEYVDCDGKAL
ncbi:hypothetical protein ACFQ0M_48760 [Kitasatospora aburaviensis]|uniref:Uncharacterized protein n=1 Tax=Kitasatospora aburaviensis TaxID=67265 RepID=A0ABW1F307_9ACTN